jgi:hypothetical protein
MALDVSELRQRRNLPPNMIWSALQRLLYKYSSCRLLLKV